MVGATSSEGFWLVYSEVRTISQGLRTQCADNPSIAGGRVISRIDCATDDLISLGRGRMSDVATIRAVDYRHYCAIATDIDWITPSRRSAVVCPRSAVAISHSRTA